MFVPMKKLLCLLTVLLMCTVSYGANTVTVEKQKTKVLVIGHGNSFVMFAQALKAIENGSGLIAIGELNILKQEPKKEEKIFNFYAEAEKLDYDYIPIIETEKSKHFYKALGNSINKKTISNKAKHFRKSRDAI